MTIKWLKRPLICFIHSLTQPKLANQQKKSDKTSLNLQNLLEVQISPLLNYFILPTVGICAPLLPSLMPSNVQLNLLFFSPPNFFLLKVKRDVLDIHSSWRTCTHNHELTCPKPLQETGLCRYNWVMIN